MAKVTNEGVEILRTLCGSRAYGLHNEDSDYDYHSVYLVPTVRLLTLDSEVKAAVKIEGDDDSVAWELTHFLKLATKGNPTVIETYVAPRIEIPHQRLGVSDYDNVWIGNMLRDTFKLVLSKHAIFNSFRGYAASQFYHAERKGETNPRRQLKAAVAYMRTMYQGTMLLYDGTYNTILPPDFVAFLRQYREATEWTEYLNEKFLENREMAEVELVHAYDKSKLPDKPNLEEINNFLIRVRRQAWSF